MEKTLQPPISTPLGRSSYSVERQSSGNLDISEAAERNVAFEKTFTEATLLGGNLADFIQQASSAIKHEPKLSAKEANERYGINGLIQFEEPIPASLAEARRDRAIQSRERDEILAAESLDNTFLQNVGVGAYSVAGALTDLTTWIPIAGPTGKIMGAVAGIRALRKATALRGALLGGAELLAAQAPKAPYLAGAARGIMDVTVPGVASEYFIYQNAMRNGYDYDTGRTIAFFAGITPIAAGIGAVATKLGTKSFIQGQKNIGSIFGLMGEYEQATLDAGNFIRNISRSDIINKDILDSIVVRQMTSLLEGGSMSQDAIRATLRLSDQTDDVQKFITNLESGRYGSVIDEKTGRVLRLDDVSGMRTAGSDFKAFVMNEMDNVLGSNKMFRALADSAGITAKYGPNVSSLGKINKVIDDLTQKIVELNAKVQKSAAQVASAPTAQRATRVAEHQVLNKELQNLIKETEELKSFKSQSTANRLDDLMAKTEIKDYTKVSSDTFRADYKKLKDRIKARKIKDVSNFFGLSEEAQKDIYKLYSMLGEDVGQNRTLEDLLKLSDEDLLMRHQDGIYKAELAPMSREQAIKILRDEYLQPEIKIRQAAKMITEKLDRDIANTIDYAGSTVEDLQKELDTMVGKEVLELPEIKEEIKNLDEAFVKETNFEKGKQAALDCFLKGVIGG